MHNDALRMIARLKISSARLGLPVDVVRFAADRDYAREVLKKFSDAADEDRVMLALELMDKLGMAPAVDPPPPPAPLPPVSAAPRKPVALDDAADERYVGRLRSVGRRWSARARDRLRFTQASVRARIQ